MLVSTGQKVANLPPVLELAEPGDEVIWVESPEAKLRYWTSTPRKVLESAGLMLTALPGESCIGHMPGGC